MHLRHCVAPSPLCLVCVSEYVLFRVAFVAGVVFDVIKEFAAAGDGRFSLATQWPSPSGGGFFISRAMQVNLKRQRVT